MCPEITGKVGAPRTLAVPFAFGYPLGAPFDARLQRKVLAAALDLLTRPGPPPVLEEMGKGSD